MPSTPATIVKPDLIRSIVVLRQTTNRQRLRKAWYTLCHSGPRALWLQIRMHVAYRSRLQKKAVLSAPMAYREPPWPAEQPLVSVVIPCFNYGIFVAEAVDSVLAQTFKDIEIILVEGGSSDGTTLEIIRSLDRPGVIKLYRDRPCPVGDNRNFGIRHARGKYVCCLDADDLILPTYIEKAVYILETRSFDVVSTVAQRFGEDSGAYEILPAPTLMDLVEGNHVSTSAVFRRTLWEQAEGYRDVPPGSPHLHEDWRFWMRLAGLGARFRNITQERLFLYRVHTRGSLSTGRTVLPMEKQIMHIRQAESAYITPRTMELSEHAAWRRLRSDIGAPNMCRYTKDISDAKTILLAVPFLVLGGAERLLSGIVGYLRKSGYRIVIVATLPIASDMGDTTSWFQPATDEIYHLPSFLEEEDWDAFVDYVITAKNVQATWIVGSSLMYEKLPKIRAQYPSMFVADLLFNAVGHTESNKMYRSYIDIDIVESQAVADYLVGTGERPERVRVIPSGIDLGQYEPAPRPLQVLNKLGLGPDAFIVGCSGRLSVEKAPMSVLSVARALDRSLDVQFVVTGTGPLEDELRDRIRQHERASQIHFVGVVDDVRTYLACYDVLLLPSELDGRPMVVLEAMAMGIPVIASAIGGLPALIEHGKNGYLCAPGDIGAYAKCIATLREDPELRQRMSVAARQFAEENLDVERMFRSYTEVFDQAGVLTIP